MSWVILVLKQPTLFTFYVAMETVVIVIQYTSGVFGKNRPQAVCVLLATRIVPRIVILVNAGAPGTNSLLPQASSSTAQVVDAMVRVVCHIECVIGRGTL